jgi:hypothetical protein
MSDFLEKSIVLLLVCGRCSWKILLQRHSHRARQSRRVITQNDTKLGRIASDADIFSEREAFLRGTFIRR